MASTTRHDHSTDRPAISLSVIIHRGYPDFTWLRHTALWLELADSASQLIEIVGGSENYRFQCRAEADPTLSDTFYRQVRLGNMNVPATLAQVVGTLATVRIRNGDPEYNCQAWVLAALERLEEHGLISSEMREFGTDGMIEAISEADDIEL
ncbi:hypothetical protein CKM354_000121700 [Cercospora kikuchii]|uniref:Uncharacterized protein n=1 Tax=Cercospora kikuchii TaxID=84275 RepID=A0A9P3C7U4_9PEZI|nr:uncharacterized protein CKM354_000121700 [Cercospora kikuchii]GIZ37781.1 hypothetical protein CKM354_000121700 [Cercospora kikuchii]